MSSSLGRRTPATFFGFVCLALFQGAPSTSSPALAAPTPALARAAAFVHSLYYGNLGNITGSAASKAFDPSTVALLQDDARLTPKGKVGALDFSPFCWCQDTKDLDLVIGPVHATGPTTAEVLVRFEYHGKMQTQAQLELVTVGDTWRVHDIDGMESHETKPTSMRSIIIRSNNLQAH
jgi:CO/xanthine dehydrogenase FAD-binding subunit